MMQHQSFKNKSRSSRMAWAKRLIALYPVSWQERYADEMLMVLEERPPTLWTFGDLLLNLCDAHLHTEIAPGKIPAIFKQLHASVTTIFCTFLLFFMLTAQGFLYISFVNVFGPRKLALIKMASYAFPYILCLIFLIMLLVGVPLIVTSCWQALKARHIRTIMLCLAGILSLLVATPASIITITMLPAYNMMERFCAALTTSVLLQSILLFVPIYLPSFIYTLFVGSGTWALWIVFQQSTPATQPTKWRMVPTLLMPPIMFAYCILPLIWLVSSLPSVLMGGKDQITDVFYEACATFPLLILIFIACCALLRIYQARRTTSAVKV